MGKLFVVINRVKTRKHKTEGPTSHENVPRNHEGTTMHLGFCVYLF